MTYIYIILILAFIIVSIVASFGFMKLQEIIAEHRNVYNELPRHLLFLLSTNHSPP